MIVVSVRRSVTVNSAARVVCAGSFGAAFAKSLWPLFLILFLFLKIAKHIHKQISVQLKFQLIGLLPVFGLLVVAAQSSRKFSVYFGKHSLILVLVLVIVIDNVTAL